MRTRIAAPGNGNKARAAITPLEGRFVHAHLSPNRRALIKAILDNHEEAYFLSSRELAKRYKVDAATVVRAIQDLGYKRYADFAADLREHFVRQITPYTVLKAATRKRRSVTDHVDGGLERDTENLRVLKSTLQTERVVELARRIHRSRRILVVGVDLAASLAWFLAYGLTPLGFAAEAPVGSAGNLQHRIDVLTGEDLVIAISFGRCLRETVESVLRARERGVPRFGITDGNSTPLAKYCDGHLIAPISSPSYTGSYVAPMALINAIILACAHLRPRRALAMLSRTEAEYRSGERWYQERLRPSNGPRARRRVPATGAAPESTR
ncbi:MAG TPA: MurR/RpiR family transcriptional regulator [Vicinamibacterales bacterium]|nr:MurR/RpiR family transcriptional regulator [Vicinamibacterales bacterium]